MANRYNEDKLFDEINNAHNVIFKIVENNNGVVQSFNGLEMVVLFPENAVDALKASIQLKESNINEIIKKYEGKNIAIGSHGTALSTIIHYYSGGKWGFDDFQRIKKVMPFIVKLAFDGEKCVECTVFEQL